MDSLPKSENIKDISSQNSGEIYAGEQQSAYGEAVSSPQEAEEQASTFGYSPQDIGAESPPPYTTDNRKKYLVFGIAAIFIVFIAALVIKLITGRNVKPPENKITLTYWGLWEDTVVMRPVIDDYQRLHSNVVVNYIKQDPREYRERVQNVIDRGEGPDIFRFHNTWLPMMQKRLSPMPKNIYSNEEFGKIFYPVIASDLSKDGNYYGIPLEIDGLLLLYNEDILKGSNVKVPATWKDVEEAVQKLTVKEKESIKTAGIALGSSENVEFFSDILGLMMLQNGTILDKSLDKCTDPKKTDCADEALSYYQQFIDDPLTTWDKTFENSTVAFAGGKVAMILAPSWQIFDIKNMNPNLNFKSAPVPQLPCKEQPCPSVNWATYWVEGVSSTSKNQIAAWEFLKYLSQKETLQKLYAEEVKIRKLFGEPYPRVDMGNLLADNLYLAPLIASAPTMKSFQLAARTYDGETGLNSRLIKYLKDAVNSLSQGVSSESALKTVNDGFKQVFSNFGVNFGG